MPATDVGIPPQLAELCFHDPRLVLLPAEHLGPAGLTPAFGDLLRERAGWTADRLALFNAGFAAYWERAAALAARTATWPPPRARHVAVVREPLAVRPYASLLNTNAWTLYDADLDPERSHAELAAYVLVLGEHAAVGGDVATAAVRSAAYWLERSDAECAAFARAAALSTRPDAAGLVAVARALDWLRRLRHVDSSPGPPGFVAIADTRLLAPTALAAHPATLAAESTEAARAAVEGFRRAWARPDLAAATELCDWLAAAVPPLLITAQGNRIVWNPDAPSRLGSLRQLIRAASGAAMRDVLADLRAVDRHTRAFFDALVHPEQLPKPSAGTEQRGYTYLHVGRGLIAYNLHEPGLERLAAPQPPYARVMLGARTVHEWAHLAVDAGWVPCTVSPPEIENRLRQVGDRLDAVIAAAPAEIRRRTAGERAELEHLHAQALRAVSRARPTTSVLPPQPSALGPQRGPTPATQAVPQRAGAPLPRAAGEGQGGGREGSDRPAGCGPLPFPPPLRGGGDSAADENRRAAWVTRVVDQSSVLSPPSSAPSAGYALAQVILARMSDFQSNLLAARFLDAAEMETYVRHNVRTLRPFDSGRLWHTLARYLYEYQYLRFSIVSDRRTYFQRSTWFDADYIATGIVNETRFADLAAAVERLCAAFAVDERQLRGRADRRWADSPYKAPDRRNL